MKRLKYFLLNMKPTSETYEEVYEGELVEPVGQHDPIIHNHAVYWDGEIGYEITKSNRLELSKPTVTIHIPIKLFKLAEVHALEDSLERGMEPVAARALKCAALDYIFRTFIPYVQALNEQNENRKRTAKENGYYYIYEPNNKVLERNVITTKVVAQKYYRNTKGTTIIPLDEGADVPAYSCISVMLQVQLPEGKHKKSVQMLCADLPDAVNRFVEEFDRNGLERSIELAKKQQEIREWLRQKGYCAFVANGSILPRAKVGDGPMQGAIPFVSTPEDEVEVAGVRGMVFRKGVTVITGGGYSGKSTLLDALSAGIYNHIAGDGRELVITDDASMKISAEDGRCIRHANLSPFIKWIPGGNPADFSTEHASGSTSQAANIMEAIGWGVNLLMIDEDKSATNFMIQDGVMKTLIEKEPITPFVERVQELSCKQQVSTILVIGGSSEYLQVADRIYMMKDYKIVQVTEEAKELQAKWRRPVGEEESVGCLSPADFTNPDEVDANFLSTRPEGSASEVLQVSDLEFVILGEERVDIRMLHDIATLPQLNAIAFLLRKLIGQVNPLERYAKFQRASYGSGLEKEVCADEAGEGTGAPAPKWICRKTEVERLLSEIGENGLESTYSPFFRDCSRWMDMPRKYEVLAVLSRMRLY